MVNSLAEGDLAGLDRGDVASGFLDKASCVARKVVSEAIATRWLGVLPNTQKAKLPTPAMPARYAEHLQARRGAVAVFYGLR